MREFIIPDKQFIGSYTAKYLKQGQLCKSVSDKNDEWALWYSVEKMAIVARCENKPRDLVIYGLAWELT